MIGMPLKTAQLTRRKRLGFHDEAVGGKISPNVAFRPVPVLPFPPSLPSLPSFSDFRRNLGYVHGWTAKNVEKKALHRRSNVLGLRLL